MTEFSNWFEIAKGLVEIRARQAGIGADEVVDTDGDKAGRRGSELARFAKERRSGQVGGVNAVVGGIGHTKIAQLNLIEMVSVEPAFQRF